MNLIIDIGNTVAKVALFDDGRLADVHHLPNQTLEGLSALCARYPVRRAAAATVIDLTAEARRQIDALDVPLLWVDATTPLPLVNLYETPHTLGYDRMAAAVAAAHQCPDHDLLVIDAGTCITYEFVDAHGRYHGGNISPGIRMRLESLHRFTGRLPLVTAEGRRVDLGKDTDTAIREGVLQGVEQEMAGVIRSMRHKYPGLLVFLTGGDEISFDTNLKSIIFADRFLVLKGLNRILEYNNDRI